MQLAYGLNYAVTYFVKLNNESKSCCVHQCSRVVSAAHITLMFTIIQIIQNCICALTFIAYIIKIYKDRQRPTHMHNEDMYCTEIMHCNKQCCKKHTCHIHKQTEKLKLFTGKCMTDRWITQTQCCAEIFVLVRVSKNKDIKYSTSVDIQSTHQIQTVSCVKNSTGFLFSSESLPVYTTNKKHV